MQTTRTIRGVEVPAFMYGTAWKEEETARLTRLALDTGFRAIDTANQRKHYFEAAVGEAVARAVADGVVAREQVFLQTKFTHLAGQDHRLPYDADSSVAEQVHQSFARSLEHLRVERVDSYVLHGPCSRVGLDPDDIAAWDAMQELQAAGKTRLLGVSNVTAEQLRAFCAHGPTPPAFVQNRCYARRGWDRAVRAVCQEQGIVYQGFSLLTANRAEQKDPRFLALAARLGRTPAQVIFGFALAVGMLPLTGTTDAGHMREDLVALALELTDDELSLVEEIGSS